MNAEKLKRLQNEVRVGGKGTPRRKKKVVHRTATTDDKKLQSSLKKMSVTPIPGIEEVNMIRDDGTVLNFINPKVQASLASHVFAIFGHPEERLLTSMLPGILNQLGTAGDLAQLRKIAESLPKSAGGLKTDDVDDDDDEVPELVENFDEASKGEGV